MKVIHLIGGGDVGGAKVHVLSLIKELNKHIEVKIISLREGMFADDARAIGLDVEVVNSNNIIADAIRLIDIISKGKYQLIHSHGSKANVFALIAKRFCRIPAVTTIHSDYRLDYMHNVLKRITFGVTNAIALRFMDYYIGVSDNFRKMLIERNFNPDRIFKIYNGIDFGERLVEYNRSDFCRKYRLNIDKDDIVIGILARLYPVKNIDTLLSAAKIALKNNSHLKFLIGGDGEDRHRLEKMAVQLGIRDNVYFLGWIDDPFELMENLDINVLTSISESFPYSILEGAYLKKATISSNVGGIPEFINDGENGYLFEPGDYETLARHILELAENKEKRDLMGEKIYQAAKQKFSLASMCKDQLDIYNSILERESVEKAVRNPVYDIIISGYYGFKNIGDDAMLQAIINNLHTYRKDLRIVALSNDPLEMKRAYGVDSIKRTNMFYIYKAMKHAKLFIYGGGNIIQDNTSTRSLFYYLSTTWLANRMRLKVMFYANGIGPLNKYINKKFTKKIINKVNVITLREEFSLQELRRLGIDKPRIILTADPALTVEMDKSVDVESIFAKESIDSAGPFIGISARRWQGLEKYAEIIALVIDYMIETYNIKPVFIPMQYPGDLLAAWAIADKMKGKPYIIKNKYNISQTLGIISKMEILVGMRLHALIFAASLNIPIIGLAYQPKIEAFLEYIHQPSAGEIGKLEYEKLRDIVDEVWNNRAQIKEKLKSDVSRLKEKAYENARIAIELIGKEDIYAKHS